ncbi:orotidine-5'-phosphate decarboxylase [Paludisphaera borealis]|uniref:Orotidine 5'-phosphate decarboxylase n=1 Tax=Paludisphaera borealis TaxID=1387353 RepID=A0A1U7CMD5_9BACT|nr:orotidine-5'-phosphate decarboxylase [Paludisphaera borealis]APW60100.1 Orotidine 5'-phosphate decarboxylase [Paludisphaera borealis]
MEFADRVVLAVRAKGNPIVAGIDPRPEELPPGFLDGFPDDRKGVADALRAFGCAIVDVVAPLAPVIKFQSAFYEAYGPEGLAALRDTIEHARKYDVLVIFDGKRNDIGTTAEAYARAYLGKVPVGGSFEPAWDVDAMTINPYLGTDGIAPFVKIASREQKGVFVLVRTSNASAGDFQDLVCDGLPVYRHVANRLKGWGQGHQGAEGYNLLGAVVGATYPQELAQLRADLPGVLLLVPGYGTQGGTAQAIAAGFDENGQGALVNSSRGITFAYAKAAYRDRFKGEWQRAVEQAVRDMIDDLAQNTPAGRLRSG